MDITITAPQSPLPFARAHSLSMVIRSFKGRRDVEVYLFRSRWDASEASDPVLSTLVETGTPASGSGRDSRTIILESFTEGERDTIVEYLKEQYSTRLTAITSTVLPFPIPAGLPGFTEIQASKDGGFIEFEKIPSYPLKFPLKGYFDLSQHRPIADDE